MLIFFSQLISTPQQGQDLLTPLEYKISVALKLITVYVTDKKGNPIEGLTIDDFIVTDNGQPVKLTELEKYVLTLPIEKSKTEEEAVEDVAAQTSELVAKTVAAIPRFRLVTRLVS